MYRVVVVESIYLQRLLMAIGIVWPCQHCPPPGLVNIQLRPEKKGKKEVKK